MKKLLFLLPAGYALIFWIIMPLMNLFTAEEADSASQPGSDYMLFVVLTGIALGGFVYILKVVKRRK
ncbi:hypothetical protein [Salibacterium halotolerans]|uniref:Uncharacterized protein n=1 Tax=Salibacterium halotolerans TaxID=1884432 RepID=A0A1I5WS19_9BACI|nr:hypothetical protein [Salibacterium halotolerans]SFQ22246.1 hypothetical protein SAMN05518683_12213 [Salibacterium halotolerans]